jgi:dipeptidyl aminopeptidase/acylaminoacyl peptidase
MNRPARWLALVLLFAAYPALAKPHTVKPGEVPVLAADEGLLLLSVDTNLKLTQVEVSAIGKRYTAAKISNMKPGTTAQLFVVRAGDYRWSRIDTSLYTRIDLDDDPKYRFHVEAGKITYAGDLFFRPLGFLSANVQVRNRGLRAMDWLETKHPAIPRQLAFVYSGLYPDAFPEFYRTEHAISTASLADLAAVDAPPEPAALPVSPRVLWRGNRVTQVRINPAGNLVAEGLQLDDTHWAIDLIDLQASSVTRLLASPAAVRSLVWTGNGTLLGGVSEAGGAEIVTVFHIGESANGTRAIRNVQIPPLGNIISTIPGDPDHIIYAAYGSDGAHLYALDIRNRGSIHDSHHHMLNDKIGHDVDWWFDGHGRLRLVMTEPGEKRRLEYGPGDGTFVPMADVTLNTSMTPVAMSFDGDLLYAISDEDRAQRDLVAIDPRNNRIVRTLFSKPGVDVDGALFDDHRTPIGVTYYQEGRLVSEYFDAGNQALASLLEKTFPGRTVGVVSRNHDGSRLVLEVEGSDQPPMLYFLDVPKRAASLLDAERPWLDGKALAASRLLKVTSADGLPIEAYLTLPAGSGRHPLLVLPHGGPVGISDRMLFDPETQFFASLGYGVLRVNFRGSDGYGKAFRKAGERALGTKIEDDIDAAIKAASATGTVDTGRMCNAGSSYGGNSALVSIVRWPTRFRCAVSVAGLSDRMLDFSATDTAASDDGRKALERIFGDPRTERDAMLAGSPVFHYRDVEVPVMLVHGEEDMRVDYEHARRMVRMLNLAGRRPVMLTFKDGEHSLGDLDQIDKTYRGIAGFLEKYLGAPTIVSAASTPTATPAASAQAP